MNGMRACSDINARLAPLSAFPELVNCVGDPVTALGGGVAYDGALR